MPGPAPGRTGPDAPTDRVAVLREHAGATPPAGALDARGEGDRYQFGDWQVEPELNLLRNGSTEHQLEPRVMGVLACLLQRAGELVTTAELLEAVWPGRTVEENAIQQRISQLRRVLGDDARAPRYIKTISRKGYRTLAAVERLAPARRASPTAPRRLVVLPFADRSRDSDNIHLSEGVSDDLRKRLARVEGLSVIARISSGEAGASALDPATIAERLGASHLVCGSLRSSDSALRLTVELIEAGTLSVLWTDEFDCSVEELPWVEARIARDILGPLGLPSVPTDRQAEVDPKAYAALLLGRHLHHDIEAAREHFELALAIEPRFAAAHAALALTWIDAINYGQASTATAFPLTQAGIERALAIDPNQVDARIASVVLMMLLEHRFQDAIDRFQELLVPGASNDRVLLIYLSLLLMIDRIEDALAVTNHWAQVDPLNANAHRARARLLLRTPNPDLTAVEGEIRIIESLIGRPEHLTRFRIAMHREGTTEAIVQARSLAEGSEGLFRLWYRLRMALLEDDRDAARALASRVVEEGNRQAHLQAIAWLVLGDTDAAVAALARGLEHGQIQAIMVLHDNCGALAADVPPWVRDAPEFEPLRRRTGLDAASLARFVVPPLPF